MRLVTGVLLACLAAVPVVAETAKKAWNVDDATRKMVKFETGGDVAKTVETGDPGPADRSYYGPGTRARMLAHWKETGRRTTWVENGVLYCNGRPSLRCGLYAPGYCCSQRHLARLCTDDPGCDPEWNPVGLEYGRLVPGSEQREGCRAQKPSQAVLDATARVIAANRGRDFGYYYLCDEPECRGQSPVYLRYLYQFVKEQDPYHVVLVCSRAAERYITCCDWVEVHPYLAPCYNASGEREFGTPLDTFGNYVEGVVAQNRPDKVVGCTPTAFGYLWTSYLQDVPTFDEYVASVWAILLEGGRSIYPFYGTGLSTSHDVYEGVRYTFSSAKALQDYLLFGRRTRLAKSERWATSLWELKGARMFAAVNFLPVPQTVTLEGVKGRYREFRGGRTWASGFLGLTGSAVTLTLAPYESVVALTDPCGTDLPTTASVKAEVARLDAARLGRDNQILGRAHELGFAASKPLGLQSGICNGMLEDQVEYFRGSASWYEISFPAGALEFDRILLHGSCLDKTTVRIREKGAWVELAHARRQVAPYCVTFTLPSPRRTVKVRFEFHQDHAELCEIEFPHVKGARPLAHPRAGGLFVKPGLFTPNPELQPGGAVQAAAPRAAATYALPGQACRVFEAANAEICTNGWSGSKWYGKDLTLQKPADGSFVLGPQGATHALVYDPAWRWVDFEIPRDGVKTTERGYSNWSLALMNHPAGQGALAGNVRSCPAGRYTIPLRPVAKPNVHGYVALREINMHVPLNYVRFSERPPTRLEVRVSSTNGVVRAGDTLTFRLVLEKPCEDVALTFNVENVGLRPYAINGSSSCELKCLDGRGALWGGELVVRRLERASAAVVVKALCLGGGNSLPVFTAIPANFVLK